MGQGTSIFSEFYGSGIFTGISYEHTVAPACPGQAFGNVRFLLSDRRSKDPSGTGFTAQALAAFNYYPLRQAQCIAFGMYQPGRFSQPNTVGMGGYRYGFNGKEKDDDITATNGAIYDYGFRIYDARIAKFLSVDPLTKKYPELSTYQFASNTPIQAIDVDGLEAFYVHGTWSNPKTFPQVTKSTVNTIFGNTEGPEFPWSGNNSDPARQLAARQLAEHIMKDNNRDPEQPLTLIGHSHGGNVVIMAANILKNEYNVDVDNIVTINTPVREYQLNKAVTAKHFNIYHSGDPVQGNGGNSMLIPDRIQTLPFGGFMPIYLGGLKFPAGEVGLAGRTFDNAVNIEVEGFNGMLPNSLGNFHDTHKRPYLWSKKLTNAVNFDINQIKLPHLEFKLEPAVRDNTNIKTK